MLLITTATELEMEPVRQALADYRGWLPLVTGVGILETAVVLADFLAGGPGTAVIKVINVGVAGAYPESGLRILDIALAEVEIVADLGVCCGDDIQPLAGIEVNSHMEMNKAFLEWAGTALRRAAINFKQGPFATVNSVSGTAARGAALRRRCQVICENMEGAATARVCESFGLPCLELRAVSNMVEDRDTSRWRLDEAARRGAKALRAILEQGAVYD
ncbi:MAG TPA: futalosine hydrolase [Desulfobacterales bacterium]|nr:futalosine hydrolase [Desulfobacterales bacterium]